MNYYDLSFLTGLFWAQDNNGLWLPRSDWSTGTQGQDLGEQVEI